MEEELMEQELLLIVREVELDKNGCQEDLEVEKVTKEGIEIQKDSLEILRKLIQF